MPAPARWTAPIAVAAVAVVAAGAGVFATYSWQQDFAAFWVAGAAIGAGLDPYINYAGTSAGLWDGVGVYQHSRFLYPPLVAVLFRPLAAMPYAVAKSLFSAASVAAWIAAVMLALRIAAPDEVRRSSLSRRRAAALAASALFLPLHIHIERGQVDLLALVLILVAWVHRDRPFRAGGALALAVLLKPAAAGLLPFLAVARRWRLLGGVGAGGALLAAITLAVCGPSRVRQYAFDVLPRVSLYGEGGPAVMLLPDERLATAAASLSTGIAALDGRTYVQSAVESVFGDDLRLGASLPRLLAPEAPDRPRFILPFVALGAVLAWAGRRAGRDDHAESLLLLAALPLCVVASPTGWAMGVVWTIPLGVLVATRWRRGRSSRTATIALASGFLLCAVPPWFAGGYVAGLMLMLVGAGVRLAHPDRGGERPA